MWAGRAAAGPGSSDHHRGQTDVAIDLQEGDLLEGREAVLELVRLHPVGHDPEGVILTADGQLKRANGNVTHREQNARRHAGEQR